MFDMRYHITSLVAVFLALAIGIILGTVIVDKGILVEQQTSLVERLEKDFERLRTENAKLSTDLRRDEQFAKESFFPLIKDRLAGQSVAVVITSPIDNALKRSISEAMQKSGATFSLMTLNLPWKVDDKAVQDRVQPHILPVQGSTLQERLLFRVADHYSAPPGDNKVLLDFAAAGLLSIDVLQAVQPTSMMIVGGSDGENMVKEVDRVLIERLKANKIRTVGVETRSRKISYMNAYQRSGIPTVDNIDERIGQVSAVYALAGVNGNFGIKPTANQLIPALSQ